ncbi:hypothetical protein QR680_009879 [Steinernema hermaphroditum]|uniref:BZIP domain-containing protein n=1 Tax=Steinernema hermaphroditum TaxID=289476 RepID=A0AA39INM9_9BILA|nr:hypothetical protein QR680_009879 [Steinernema hermaphroditum]
MAYYPPQSYYYQSAAVPPPPPGSYFHPYPNFGLPAPPIPQPQVSVSPSAINDSGFSSQPASPDEGDKENIGVRKAPSKPVKEAILSEEERKKYRERRDRNNLAAKLSRAHRKQREQELSKELHETKQVLSTLQEHNAMIVRAIHAGAGIAEVVTFLQNPPLPSPSATQGFPTFF